MWSCHRDIAARAAKGRKYTLREFDRAAEFFERLTGIPADSLPTDLGPVPGKELGGSLREWDAWYSTNGSRLRWDGPTRSVVLGP